MDLFQDWLFVLTRPSVAFSQKKADASFINGLESIVIAGVIYGLYLTSITTFRLDSRIFLNLVIFSATFVIESLFGIGVLFLFAKLLTGKADFKTHFFILSELAIPLVIIYSFVFFVSTYVFSSLFLLFPVLGLYGVYLITIALKEAHEFGTARAVATWLIPMVIVALVVVVLVSAALYAFMGGPGNYR